MKALPLEAIRARIQLRDGALWWVRRDKPVKLAERDGLRFTFKHGGQSYSLNAGKTVWLLIHGEWPDAVGRLNGDLSDLSPANLFAVATSSVDHFVSGDTTEARANLLRERVVLADGALLRRADGRPITTHLDKDGYRLFGFKVRGRWYGFSEHRAMWLLHYGDWPAGQIDHINRNPADNRIENLRVVTQSENNLNRVFARPGGYPKSLVRKAV